ncbi:MAG: class I tRNA ligase family protein, partial [Candidatus Sungbacteria bacterium]|nr:class I tRNA ligase family protein [Candidatus Sungbacteria bacterium]
NYITALGYGEDSANFKKYWEGGRTLHVIGKGINRFHTVYWPAMLLSAGVALPKEVFVHGYITIDGQKISKTIGNVVDPVELVKKYGTDPVRYYLLREIPSYEDGDFSVKKFEERYNGDLANGIGNLVSRVATLGEKLGVLDFDFSRDVEPSTKIEIEKVFQEYETHMGEIRLNEALGVIWRLVSHADGFINEKKPWALTDSPELKLVITNAAYVIGTIANLLLPFLPGASEKILAQIRKKKNSLEKI